MFKYNAITLSIFMMCNISQAACPPGFDCNMDGKIFNGDWNIAGAYGAWSEINNEELSGKTLTVQGYRSFGSHPKYAAAASDAQNSSLIHNTLTVDYTGVFESGKRSITASAAFAYNYTGANLSHNTINIESGLMELPLFLQYSPEVRLHAAVIDPSNSSQKKWTGNLDIKMMNNIMNIKGKSGKGNMENSREYFVPHQVSVAQVLPVLGFDTEVNNLSLQIRFNNNILNTRNITLHYDTNYIDQTSEGVGAVYLGFNEAIFKEVSVHSNFKASNNQFNARDTHFEGGPWSAVGNYLWSANKVRLHDNVTTIQNSTHAKSTDTLGIYGPSLVHFMGVGALLQPIPHDSRKAYDYTSVLDSNGVRIINNKHNGDDGTGALGWIVGAVAHLPTAQHSLTMTNNYAYIEDSVLRRNGNESTDYPKGAYDRFVVAGAIFDNPMKYDVDTDHPQYTVTKNYVHVKNSYVDSAVFGAASVRKDSGVLQTFTPIDGDNYLIIEGQNELCYVDGFAHIEFRLSKDDLSNEPNVIIHNHRMPGIGAFNMDNRRIYITGINIYDLKEDKYLIAHRNPSSGRSAPDIIISADNASIQQKPSTFLRTSILLDNEWDGWLHVADIPEPEPDKRASTLQHFVSSKAALLNEGSTFIADEILDFVGRGYTEDKWSGFAALQAGSSNYKGKLRTDLDSTHLMVGAATGNRQYNLALFADIALGRSEDSFNTNKTKEELYNYGLGIGGSYFINSSWFVNGSLRMGYSKSRFDGQFVVASENIRTQTNLTGYYLASHVGTGYQYNLNDTWSITPFARITYTYVQGDDSNIYESGSSNTLKLDDLHEYTGMLGLFVGQSFEKCMLKYGLGYEYTHFNNANLYVNDIVVGGYDETLHNALLEFAISSPENRDQEWQWHLGIKGYLGDRSGISGQAIVEHYF